jgi:hypothetical protein
MLRSAMMSADTTKKKMTANGIHSPVMKPPASATHTIRSRLSKSNVHIFSFWFLLLLENHPNTPAFFSFFSFVIA